MIMKFLRTAILGLSAGLILAIAPITSQAATLTFSNGGGNGSGALTTPFFADYLLVLIGNNNKSAGKTSTWSADSGDDRLKVEFIWSYNTTDLRGPSQDPLSFFIGNTVYALSQSAGGSTQGDVVNILTFFVAKNTTFGWKVESTDGKSGRGRGVVATNISAVPLPAGGLLLLGAMGGLAALRRRKMAA